MGSEARWCDEQDEVALRIVIVSSLYVHVSAVRFEFKGLASVKVATKVKYYSGKKPPGMMTLQPSGARLFRKPADRVWGIGYLSQFQDCLRD